ncbi:MULTISPECIES: DUF432 domain-containing protein [Archaeoglobus]|uniref:DUF432 domain-containing protein n=2 Tax=Archaeoglobus fulgidus TaxID=2234 RepID=O28727_ARCFU|nr:MULTISPECIES: DUF432 domain-containing protein [Archaeoglobus]AAB89713.1 predicted coding region AF_1545 [Archaeoglobus fulgidus DSM 4304]AIG98556.1 hypothetical protein AFULGI_00017990 [Archaeoglobus fulgidus DSM 8774]MDI3496812.1 uncharacterized protein [Archaeoglobus sp.]
MFGYHDVEDFQAEIGEYKIKTERIGPFYSYVRENGERKEKNLSVETGRIIVNPVEPVNLPKEITNFLQIKFSKPFLAEPKSAVEVYATFPVEIAVFIAAKKNVGLVDVFSLQKPKYTLYGNPRAGIICRYWESELYSEIPQVDKYREGVIKLRIVNSDDEWVEVSNAVFDVYGMKIYYNEEMVCSSASVNIVSPKVAETRFIEQPLREKMKKALELYTARRIAVTSLKFVMEWGL